MEPSDPIRCALIECLRFMIVEEHWECFQAEFLYEPDSAKGTASENNAEKLRQFLRKLAEGHKEVAECVVEAGKREY